MPDVPKEDPTTSSQLHVSGCHPHILRNATCENHVFHEKDRSHTENQRSTNKLFQGIQSALNVTQGREWALNLSNPGWAEASAGAAVGVIGCLLHSGPLNLFTDDQHNKGSLILSWVVPEKRTSQCRY